MENYKYKISVIIPVYNVYDYLEETIKSVIGQSIGFKENIQMILVNDGSPDNSEEICLKYKNKYPDNIIYIKQENGGVSSARNNGLKYATGEFINFLDSDDKWENDALEKGYKMLLENKDIDMVFYRIKFFEASTSYHPLDYMFEGKDRVLDLHQKYQFIKLQCCSILFRSSAIDKEKNKFNQDLKISEDVRFITEILFNNMKVGLVGSSTYLYRKRFNETSAIQGSIKNKSWYVDTPKLCYKYLFDLSKEKYGRVIKYIQYLVLYDLKWRLFRQVVTDVISQEEEKEYLDILGQLLNDISDEVIIDFSMLNDFQKLYVLSYKYKNKLDYSLKDDNVIVNKKLKVNIENFKIELGTIEIHNDIAKIYTAMPQLNNYFDKLYVENEKGKLYQMKKYELDASNKIFKYVNQDYSLEKKGYYIEVPLNEVKQFRFVVKIGNKTYRLKYALRYNFAISKKNASAFLESDNYFVKYNKKEEYFYVLKRNFVNRIKLEILQIYHMLKKKKIKQVVVRTLAKIYSIYKKISKKEIWIISDRLNVAGDNGEAFFRYLVNNNIGNDKYYFVISGESSDGKKLKEEFKDKILFSESLKYKILFLNSSKIISAQADDYVTNPFGKAKKYYSDFLKFKFIFLQHGLTKEDLSPWLNINNKLIDLFCVSTKEEQDSIYKFNYNYSKSVAKLTGMARYDLLKSENTKKIILLMPTWRKGLIPNLDPVTGLRKYDSKFKNTTYFNFFNNLINDKRLIDALKESGYKIKFVLHNNMQQQAKDFTKNEYVIIEENGVSYKDEFNNSALLVTDYSSVFFDFAYLNKPIIYTQFDSYNFFKGQVFNKGYYDYEKDGFGPVCYDLEDTIKTIIDYIKKDCKIEDKYSKRINSFYGYRDNKNCERIYNEIKKL